MSNERWRFLQLYELKFKLWLKKGAHIILIFETLDYLNWRRTFKKKKKKELLKFKNKGLFLVELDLL